MGMFRVGVFVALSLLVFAGRPVFAVVPDDQVTKYWADLGLTTDFLETQILNQQNCYSSQVKLLGCVKAVDSLLQGKQLAQRTFLTAPGLPQTGTVTVDKDFGYYKIASTVAGDKHATAANAKPGTENEEKAAMMAEVEKTKAQLAGEEKFWRGAQANAGASMIPFDQVIAWAKQNRLAAGNESQEVGQAYNIYLATAVDAHSYVEPEALIHAEMQEGAQDFSGIGVEIKAFDGHVVVTNPIEGGPAFKAGIRPNDIISAVNGQDVTGGNADEIADKIRGRAGTAVTLGILRGTQTVTVTVTRAQIHLDNVTYKTMTTSLRGSTKTVTVGDLKIRDFMEQNTCKDVENALRNVSKVDALIVDLRGNPGGELDVVACVAGLFIGSGQLVVQERSLDTSVVPNVDLKSKTDRIVHVPVVTLVDAESASAAEILSGDLQDYGAGAVVGERSWGKGSIQELFRWDVVPGAIISQTIARFYLPGNSTKPAHTNQIIGIVPDIAAYDVPNPTDWDKYAFREADFSPIVLDQKSFDLSPPNPTLTASIDKCRSARGVADQKYDESLGGVISPDYQKLVAEDVAACLLP